MDFEDRMIEAVERGECSEDEAYDYVRDSLADAAERAGRSPSLARQEGHRPSADAPPQSREA
jgi:hypothetical protein